MTYQPIKEVDKENWIKWLESQVAVLNGKGNSGHKDLFETGSDDIETAKDLVGNLLALLTNKSVTID